MLGIWNKLKWLNLILKIGLKILEKYSLAGYFYPGN